MQFSAYTPMSRNESNPGSEIASYLPIIGTAMDAKEMIDDPSLENAGWLALSVLSEIPFLKWLKGTRAAKHSLKAARPLLDYGKRKIARDVIGNTIDNRDEPDYPFAQFIWNTAIPYLFNNQRYGIVPKDDKLFRANKSLGSARGLNRYSWDYYKYR